MNATFTNNATKDTVKVNICKWMMIIISYFIYIFNYKRWAAYIDDLIKKYTTTQESCAERVREWTKEKNNARKNFVNDFWNRYKDVDYSKINLSEGKIPENFKPMTLNEVATALLPEKKPLEDEDRDVNKWYYMDNDTKRYKGEWKNGAPNGKGAVEFIKNKSKDFEGKILQEHSVIECTFVDGLANGYGRQIFERTYEKMVPYYEGDFKNNNQHGYGEYHYGTGDYYKGEFREGKFNGQGIDYDHKTNKTFVGEFYNDGKLKGKWVDGEVEYKKPEKVFNSDNWDELNQRVFDNDNTKMNKLEEEMQKKNV